MYKKFVAYKQSNWNILTNERNKIKIEQDDLPR